ncbi:spore coat protein [archaeon]|nr:MAG: spore coat protein [archaeon]
MKGVVLAGGLGTRLRPATKVTNKHLLPVYDKPMIFYPIETLVKAGVKDILIVTGPEHGGHFLHLLGSGKEFGAKITYELQEEPAGIADGLRLAERFADNDKLVAILGDNIFETDITEDIKDFEKSTFGAKIFLKEVDNPQRFGVAEMNDSSITKIIEKPTDPKTKYAVTGMYMYDSTVFNVIRNLKPSARGQLEITDVNNHYISDGKMTFRILNDFWSDAGTHESLFKATEFIRGLRLA